MRFENGLIFVGGRFVSGGFSVEDGRFAHVLADAADGGPHHGQRQKTQFLQQ